MKTHIALLALLSTGIWSAFSQGFMNLNFNSAQVSAYGVGPAFVPVTNAIPGWTGYLGGIQQATVLYNSISEGSANLSILGANNPDYPYSSPIPGNKYTMILQAGPVSGSSSNVSAAIAQTGLIPSTALSILFTASVDVPGVAGWQVTIAGQVIPVIQISSIDSYYAVYGGNVSAFAGQVEQLEFTDLGGSQPNPDLSLDAISFSSSPIPEPSVIGLSALGGLLLAWHYRRNLHNSRT